MSLIRVSSKRGVHRIRILEIASYLDPDLNEIDNYSVEILYKSGAQETVYFERESVRDNFLTQLDSYLESYEANKNWTS